MSAYWISVYKEISDEAKVAAYAELAGPALRAAGGTFLARGLPEQTYESGERTRTVLLEFAVGRGRPRRARRPRLPGGARGPRRRRGPGHAHPARS